MVDRDLSLLTITDKCDSPQSVRAICFLRAFAVPVVVVEREFVNVDNLTGLTFHHHD
jgi:hypothetical protein